MAIFSTTYLITSFLVIFFPNNYAAASVTFNLTHIGPESENLDIVTEGDASYISNNGIQLTPGDVGPPGWGIGGRAKYIRPLHLWDHKSGELASFFTNFTFVIDSNHATKYGGGLTFFLAQNNSVITGGDAMGLPVDVTSLKASTRFVAVRFLASGNPRWDPSVSNDDRVGISISSLATVTYKKWLSNVPDGGVCQAWITYDSVSKKLTVSFTGFENDTVVTQDELAYTVDLRKHLPQWVIFGFSAGSRDFSNQRHVVRSWSFHSSDISLNVKDYKARLIVGVWVTIILILVVLPVVLWKWKKKKNLEDEEEEHEFDLHGTKRLVEAADPRLGSDFDQEELKRLMTVGLWCAHPDPHFRPSMRQVIQVLNCETSVPTLPSDMPVVTYSTCPTSLLYGVTSIVQDQLLKMGND
ncbi:hypothetical protein QVD17_27414 [Tagetes erecta]|uniref:Legume lectin domain-containing protein n=1 Tax=Tagetes erecta TaxID=13708 RepID=A0AAD8KBU2_TARER|nr:hypothetical protein QVD17_27414 [Tagetes erecta]